MPRIPKNPNAPRLTPIDIAAVKTFIGRRHQLASATCFPLKSPYNEVQSPRAFCGVDVQNQSQNRRGQCGSDDAGSSRPEIPRQHNRRESVLGLTPGASSRLERRHDRRMSLPTQPLSPILKCHRRRPDASQRNVHFDVSSYPATATHRVIKFRCGAKHAEQQHVYGINMTDALSCNKVLRSGDVREFHADHKNCISVLIRWNGHEPLTYQLKLPVRSDGRVDMTVFAYGTGEALCSYMHTNNITMHSSRLRIMYVEEWSKGVWVPRIAENR
ncbi:hypothetical protein FISHEDRAFT_60793 [Fistulina hepatica ATCC 64428]|uniref:DUF6741 domain-containing protein n=1 Tax=Fistulina hepatica ATCC 64428 TaxID=1128425 RepID=A0A0D7A7Q7_9AGAR|nr:hypothetical protein FISHEDRAFT_60793 [Fistulina hepatica ATCC 64428]